MVENKSSAAVGLSDLGSKVILLTNDPTAAPLAVVRANTVALDALSSWLVISASFLPS